MKYCMKHDFLFYCQQPILHVNHISLFKFELVVSVVGVVHKLPEDNMDCAVLKCKGSS